MGSFLVPGGVPLSLTDRPVRQQEGGVEGQLPHPPLFTKGFLSFPCREGVF